MWNEDGLISEISRRPVQKLYGTVPVPRPGRYSGPCGSSIYGVRYYSPRAATWSTIVRSRATTIGKETAIASENETGYVDAQEAAKILGMSQRAVRNLVARGSLEPKRDGEEGVAARLVVSVASVERLRSERNQ